MIEETITKLVTNNKGILAADESVTTIGKRFSSINVENTEDNRRDYRDILLSSPLYEKYISGVILHEETLYQKNIDNKLIIDYLKSKDIIIGIKVDEGLESLSEYGDEKITKGLDTLEIRCKNYFSHGARFTKWRCVFKIDEERDYPSLLLINRNVQTLVKYAMISISCNMVPIIEPEILMEGTFTMEKYSQITKKVLKSLFTYLRKCEVNLNHVILKVNMIIPSSNSDEISSLLKNTQLTYRTLKESVDPTIPVIVFLSGGQSEEDAQKNLESLSNHYQNNPWMLSFSYSRALQYSALNAWKGDNSNKELVQKVFLEKARKLGLSL